MQANDLLKYRDKVIDAFKDDTFQSVHLKNDAAHDYVLDDVNSFIQKIESMAEKINLSLFNDFVESSSLVDYAKTFINTKNPDKNKESIVEIKDRLSDLNDKIKKMNEKEKEIKMLMRHQRLLKKFLGTIKMLKKVFCLHQKLIKENQNQRLQKELQKEYI